MLDRKWMSCDRCSREYIDGAKEFIEFAANHADDANKIICPCMSCFFGKRLRPLDLLGHLICHGIDPSYTRWTMHGETYEDAYGDQVHDVSSGSNVPETDMCDESDDLEEMLNVMGEEDPEIFQTLKSDAETPLYLGCTKYTRLRAVLKLYMLKARYGWSDASFTALLSALRDILPEANVLPSKTCEAKQILRSTGMKYEKIHACPNDCILFRNQYASLKKCPKCDTSRYGKKSNSPSKVLWYFPIIPRFKRMFNNADIAKLLTWHADERIEDIKLRHPADAPQWKTIDYEYPEFGEEPRNLRLALATDGINLHGLQSSTHSTWSVILMIYNLPPNLIMKRKFMMLSMLISGPRQPDNDIDVYLDPLIEDLKYMWDLGEIVFDGCRGENFKLRAMLFGTINDFSAYGHLSGYNIKGYGACPICEDDTHSIRLDHCKKNVYMGHRRFLPLKHRWRRWKKAFNENSEEGRPPRIWNRVNVFEKVKALENDFGKPFAKNVLTSGWKKRSIFFELPYWKSLYVRHFLDVIHIQKSICDNLIGTLLDMHGKSKDGVNSRLDMVKLGIRQELAPIERGYRTYLPPAAYTLSSKEKRSFFEFLNGIKVPKSYSLNVKNFVSMKELKLKNLKSHDCHILMQNFLPVGIRNILPKKVRSTITRLCMFFKLICSEVVDREKLQDLQRQIVCILCELEMYFPPSFFDIMVHLTVHLVKEVQLCGPVYLRWMYPIERFMKVLKGYVKNIYRPEGCIAERYIVEEASDLCANYLSNVEPVDLPKSRHDGRLTGRGISGFNLLRISNADKEMSHLYILHNTPEVEPFIKEHKKLLRDIHGDRNESLITKEHNKHFIRWFNARICQQVELNAESVCERLFWLSKGPGLHAFSYTGYSINGYTFYTKGQDERSTMQNSGVTVVADARHISSARDTNPICAQMSYFGVIDCIWELDYTMFKVPVFRCQWVNNHSGRRLDEFGFISVDLSKVGYKDDPYILASQAAQVFYIADPSKKNWSIVMQSNKNYAEQIDEESSDTDMNMIEHDPSFETVLSEDFDTDESDDEDKPVYVRRDHEEGIWVNTTLNPIKKRKQTILDTIIKRKKRRRPLY